MGTIAMMLLTAVTSVAFAATYAVLMTMVGRRADALSTALLGRPAQAASRRFSLA
jgi:hypothetical protein